MKNGGGHFLLVIIINTILLAVKMVFPPIAIIYSMRYNSPMTLIASIIFFTWVMQWSFQSGIVNKVAKSVLAVYICSEMIPFVYYGALHRIQDVLPLWAELIAVPAYIIAFFLAFILVDKVRILITTPSQMWVVDKLNKFTVKHFH